VAFPRKERAYEKHAWIILLAIGVFWTLLGVTYGQSVYVTTQYAVWLIRTLLVGMGIFGVAITLRPYRRGEKWAWFVLWYWPAHLIIHSVAFGTYPIDGTLAFVTFLGLALPVRKFFPQLNKGGIIGLGVIGLAILGFIVLGTIFRAGIPIYSCTTVNPTTCVG
jgi:hypothetical protein